MFCKELNISRKNFKKTEHGISGFKMNAGARGITLFWAQFGGEGEWREVQ